MVPLRQISWRLQSDDRLNLLSSENSAHAQSLFSPIVMLTTPLQTGSTVLSGQWDCIVLLPSNVWQQFFGRSAPEQQEADFATC
ncbi:hypothetical protein TNCV_2059941 [Trichonephila clavipes]|nr:hypothetical protein TNCV_2059941 [Trichonephila clavipes]